MARSKMNAKGCLAAVAVWAAFTVLAGILVNYFQQKEIKDRTPAAERLGNVDLSPYMSFGQLKNLMGRPGKLTVNCGAENAVCAEWAAGTVMARFLGNSTDIKDEDSDVIELRAELPFKGTICGSCIGDSDHAALRKLSGWGGKGPQAVLRKLRSGSEWWEIVWGDFAVSGSRDSLDFNNETYHLEQRH